MHLRVLVHPPAAGAWNMAVDEAILDAPPPGDTWTLRFYAWARPTVSLGFGQRHGQAFEAQVARREGIAFVRRPTGGRAVLHADELTYALVGPADRGPLQGGITAAYRNIAEGFARGLERLGVVVALHKSSLPPPRIASATGSCFSARARYELTAGGRKLMGSAQRRRDGTVLQHGSLLLGRPQARLWRSLGAGYEEAAAGSVGLVELLGERPAKRRLMASIADGVAEVLDLPVRHGALSRAELRLARRLQRRYEDPAWTKRR